MLAQGIDQPFHPMPVQLQAGADDQAVVLDNPAAFQEDSIARYFAVERNERVQVRRQPYRRDYMIANIDRLIVGKNGVLECKNASEYMLEAWEGPEHSRGPQYYRIQVHHQVVTANKEYGVLAAFVGGNKYRDAIIERDAEIAELLIAKEGEFWSYVERDTPPPVTTAEEVLTIYEVTKGKAIIASPELIEFHRELIALRDDVKKGKDRVDELKDLICSQMLDADELLGPDGKPIVTWRKTNPKKEVTNWEAAYGELATFARDWIPDPDEELARIESAHTRLPAGTRVFLPKKPKEKKQ